MKETKATDLRDKSVPELEDMLAQERATLYKARRDLVFRQITNTNVVKNHRHNIARILHVITEKKRGGEA